MKMKGMVKNYRTDYMQMVDICIDATGFYKLHAGIEVGPGFWHSRGGLESTEGIAR